MKKHSIKFEKATKELVKEYYGSTAPVSFKGYVATLNGKVVGVGGISKLGNLRVLFSEFKEDMRPYKRDIARAIRVLEQEVSKMKMPIFAVANKAEPSSKMLLEKLGFEPTGNENENGPIYVRMPWVLCYQSCSAPPEQQQQQPQLD